jgi:hypothetical protein
LKSNSADPTWLALGSNGFVLTSNGSDAVWAVLPASGVTGDSDQLVLGSQVFS